MIASADYDRATREAPSSSEDDDELYRLGERIAELAARINSAEARMMTLIADFDRRGGWKDGGYSSCAEWLAWRLGMKIGPARERVRAARALESLPQTADALAEGTISYTKVRALTRVATPEREAELLEFARASSAARLERTLRMWKKLSRDEELTAEQARRRSRTFSIVVDGDGMYVVKGRLEPEVGAVLMRAVEAASDTLFRREEGADSVREGVSDDPRPKPKQRRADAVGLLAERALAVGFGGGDPHVVPPSRDEPQTRFREETEAQPHTEGPAQPRVESGTRAERYQVMVHCDAATLAAEGEPGRSDLDGIRGLRGNVAAHGVRCRGGRDGPRPGRVGAERGPQDAHDSAAHPAGAGGARPGMPFSGVRLPVHRGASREALGRRGRDEPEEQASPFSHPIFNAELTSIAGWIPAI